MNTKKVIVSDLDGTLAESKSPLSEAMAEVLGHVLKRHYIAVISGGSYGQFQKQFLSQLTCGPEELRNLLLFPTMGGSAYTYDYDKKKWIKVYEEKLNSSETKKIIAAFNEAIADLKLDLSGNFGEILEARGSQVTFSGKGQEAPIDVKNKWDPDQAKRRKIAEKLIKELPEFDVHIGGATSIDVTKKGINKAYAIEKLKRMINVEDDDMIFIGDALYKGGNDESIKQTGIDYVQENGPGDSLEFLSRYM